LSSYSIQAPATLVYNLDAAALGGRVGTTITTSASFNGTTQRLSTTGLLATAVGSEATGTNMGTGNFTWECWVRATASTGYQTFIDTRGYSTGYSAVGTDGAVFGLDNNTLTPYYFSDSGAVITSTINLTLNVWTHVAVVRNSGTTTLYVNGVSGGSAASDTTDLSAPYVNIGGVANLGPNYLTGQISNLRMVKGTAVYTAGFVPPTTTLRAIAGTNLLMPLIASPFMDLSSNILPIVNTGTVAATAQAPALTTGVTDVTNTYTLTYSLPVATFTGSIASTTLTVASGLTGTVTLGMAITGGSIPVGTYIVSQLTGTTGSTGTYSLNTAVTQASTSITGAKINWAGTQGGIFTSYYAGDGIAAYIIGGPNIPAATKYTVMMAYKLNVGAVANYGKILGSNTTAYGEWLMGGYSGYVSCYYSNGTTINLGATRDVVWHIDFVTFDLAKGNVFSSTSTQPTATPSFTANSTGISGFNQLRLYAQNAGFESGAADIGMVKVWTGVLTTTQMQAQYAAYKARFGY
jgi:hypothetical protein